MTRPIALLPILLAAGCGAAGAPAAGTTASEQAVPAVVEPTAEEEQLVSGYETDVETLEADLLSSFELAEGPDCDQAGELRDRICDLSERICAIADRHPGWSDVEGKCGDGRERCERARDEVAERCGEADR